MDRNLFKIEKIETASKFIRSQPAAVSIRYAVLYKGVEINRFVRREDAEACVTEAVMVRDDAQWAYDDALRADGYPIPA